MESLESKYNRALDDIAFWKRIVSELKVETHRLRLLIAQTEVEERIQKLQPAAADRLRKIFNSTDVGGLRAAVKVEGRKTQ